MELWIRSQDKNILEKVNKLYVATCEEENGFGIYDIRYDDLDDCDVPLGFYKTKERALEILTEMKLRKYIENKKNNKKIIVKIKEENLYDFCIKLLKIVEREL